MKDNEKNIFQDIKERGREIGGNIGEKFGETWGALKGRVKGEDLGKKTAETFNNIEKGVENLFNKKDDYK